MTVRSSSTTDTSVKARLPPTLQLDRRSRSASSTLDDNGLHYDYDIQPQSPQSNPPPDGHSQQYRLHRSQHNLHKSKRNNKHQSPTSASLVRHTKTANSLTPITAHYSLNKTLLYAFQSLVRSGRDSTALAVGLQLCRVAVWDIPNHGYYKSPRYAKEREKSIENVLHVCLVLKGEVLVRLLGSVRIDSDDWEIIDDIVDDEYVNDGQDGSNGEEYKVLTVQDLEEKREEVELLIAVATVMADQLKKEKRGINDNKSTFSSPSSYTKRSSWMDAGVCSRIFDCDDMLASLNGIQPHPTPPKLDIVTEADVFVDDDGDLENDHILYSKQGKNQNEEEKEKEKERSKQMYLSQSERFRNQHVPTILPNEEMKRTSSSPAALSPPPPSSLWNSSSMVGFQSQSQDEEKEDRNPQPPTQYEQALQNDVVVTANVIQHVDGVVDDHGGTVNVYPQSETQYESDLERALYLSGLEFETRQQQQQQQQDLVMDMQRHESKSNEEQCQASPDADELALCSHPSNLKPADPDAVKIQTLTQLYHKDFDQMLQMVQSSSDSDDHHPFHPEHQEEKLDPSTLYHPHSSPSKLPTNINNNNNKKEKENRGHSILVEYMDTYQGRIPESTNGCTVIAPLLAIHHLASTSSSLRRGRSGNRRILNQEERQGSGEFGVCERGGDGIEYVAGTGVADRNSILWKGWGGGSDVGICYDDCDRDGSEEKMTTALTTIRSCDENVNPASSFEDSNDGDDEGVEKSILCAVIDIQAPLVLPEVRNNLGLTKDALIIPSDVHDYLMDQNFLLPSQFVNVFGGNILDDDHLGQLLLCLVNAGRSSSSANKRGEVPGTTGASAATEDLKKKKPKKNKKKKDTKDNGKDAVNGETKVQQERVKKIAATLFFHEHVVCINRLVRRRKRPNRPQSAVDRPKDPCESSSFFPMKRLRSKNKKRCIDASRLTTSNNAAVEEEEEIWFDIIDSLPSAYMMSRPDGGTKRQPDDTRSSVSTDDIRLAHSVESAIVQQPSTDNVSVKNEDVYYYDNASVQEDGWLTKAVRIRCTSIKSLETALRWYACSKFTSEDQKFINSYKWDDFNVDFDPRVFQAFVWSEPE